ncbi:MAG: hypothetical protein IPN14_00205 [Bacteroidetes bacterium]|nr:hypothetical protein [Bacteroidota bacterium]
MPTTYFKNTLNGGNLAMLFQAYSKNIFPLSRENEIIYTREKNGDLEMYFESAYFPLLIAAINENAVKGNFSNSSSRNEWNDLIQKLKNAVIIELQNTDHFSVYGLYKETNTTINEIIDSAQFYIETEQIPQAEQRMIVLYNYIVANPFELNKIDNPDNFASVIATMLQFKVLNDDDAIEQIAGIGYVVISKSIYLNPAPNKNMFRLLMMHFAREQFNFIFRTAFDFLNGGNPWSASAQMIPTQTANAIYKMEISDIYLNPIIYQKIPMFADAKYELDRMISNNHFYNQTLEEIIEEGILFHKKAFDYLKEKYLTESKEIIYLKSDHAVIRDEELYLDLNSIRIYNGQEYTVAALKASGWTDAQIEQYTSAKSAGIDSN